MSDPREIVATRRPGLSVVGWKLEPARRAELLGIVTPLYEKTVADHVTLAAKVASDTPLPRKVNARAVGRADDGAGVEALVVEIDGDTNRPDGSTYHITWSLGPGRKARESNDVIAARGWRELDAPLALDLMPARFP